MYDFQKTKVVFTAKGREHIASINAEEHNTYKSLISNLTPAEMVVMFNDAVTFLQDKTDQGRTIPSTTKKFADKLTAIRRFTEISDRVAEAIKDIEPLAAVEPVIEDKPTKPATVVKAPKAKKTAKAEDAGIVEVKGPKALGALVTCVASKKDGSTYVVGQRSFTDDMKITNIAEKAGHVDRDPRWHLYRDGMTVAEFLADAKAWLRTQPEFAGRPDGGPNGLNWKVRDWLAADAKRSNRVTIS
jgi:hypothetical protein